MKITAIIGAIAGNDYNCSGVLKIIYDTMNEIGETINIINLSEANLPYCSNSFVQGAFSTIEKEVNSSDGIILITTSNLFAPSAIMQNFLEHLSQPVYKNTLKNKNVMTVAISNVQDVSSTINYLSKAINYLGGYDSVKIPLNYALTKNISEEDKLLLEKYTEDFYRYVKQNRRFFTPNYSNSKATKDFAKPAGGVFQKPVVKNSDIPTPIIETPVVNSNNLMQDLNMNQHTTNTSNINVNTQPTKQQNNKQTNFNNPYAKAQMNNQNNNLYKAQDDDILEITKTLTNKMSKPEQTNNFGVQDIFNNDLTNYNTDNISPTTLNAKQMTQNLIHYYQPHLADGLSFNLGLNITGLEAFDGAITINNHLCDYVDNCPNPDVIITATDDIWKQIIKGTSSSQRAFMTGQIKVRGNFVLLSKFDTLFKR